MESFEPKKAALIRILQILQKYTNVDHPLKHDEIVKLLEQDYGLIVERKSVGRNIALLNEVGYEIETTKNGSYLVEKLFDDSELRLLIDCVLSGKHVTERDSHDIIEKLLTLSDKYFKPRIKYVSRISEWDKTNNSDLFYNMELIDEAVSLSKQVSFQYNKYGADKKLHASSRVLASPYQMILHNQRYYLMAYNDQYRQMKYYRLDRITDMTITDKALIPIKSIEGYENGIDYKRFSSQMPYMFADEVHTVTFYTEPWAIDQIIDWFGKDIVINEEGDRYLVKVKTSLMAMEFWALQYSQAVEILTPESLRKSIIEKFESALRKYES